MKMLKESFTFSEFITYGLNNLRYFAINPLRFGYIDYLDMKTCGKLLCMCYQRQFRYFYLH